ncbi:MAG: hypothetical protein JNN12_12845 [Bacteroidetes Order II. Incertae sedis bacterium]|nr:hypothetical protein [Bacteroidetes Order II. bacterium]
MKPLTPFSNRKTSLIGTPVPQTPLARFLMGAVLVLVALIPMAVFAQEAAEDAEAVKQYFGWLSLIPPIVVVAAAILMKRAFEPLVLGCLVGFVMTDGLSGFFTKSVDTTMAVLMDESSQWVIMVCGLYGSLIFLLMISGSALAVGEKLKEHAKTPRSALLVTWFMGIFLFLDDYLNALTAGVTMRKVTDSHRISREMLAFVVSSMAVTASVLIPMSTWQAYVGELLVTSNLVTEDNAWQGFVWTIPYNVYAWVSLFLAPLVIFKVLPMFSGLTKAELRAQTTGQLVPDGSEHMVAEMPLSGTAHKAQWFDFVVPVVVLIAATFWMEIDALKGIFIAIVFTILYYWGRGLATFNQLSDGIWEGFKSMVFALGILMLSYILKKLGDDMGLTEFVVDSIKDVNKGFLPLLVFVSLGAISFATGNNWGMYAIAIPLMVPVAAATGINPYLLIGAIIAAGVFGAHGCYYSDARVLVSAATEVDNVRHGQTQIPLVMITFAVTCLIYLVLGFTA